MILHLCPHCEHIPCSQSSHTYPILPLTTSPCTVYSLWASCFTCGNTTSTVHAPNQYMYDLWSLRKRVYAQSIPCEHRVLLMYVCTTSRVHALNGRVRNLWSLRQRVHKVCEYCLCLLFHRERSVVSIPVHIIYTPIEKLEACAEFNENYLSLVLHNSDCYMYCSISNHIKFILTSSNNPSEL